MDRRRFIITGASTATLISVAGCTGSSAEAASLTESQENGGVALTVTEIQLANEMVVGSGDRYLPDTGNRFAFLKVESRNTGSDIIDLARRNELQLLIGDSQYGPFDVNDKVGLGSVPDSFEEPVSGDRYEAVAEARPDIASEGWIVFEIPSDTSDARLSWAREFEQEEPLYWALEFEPGSLADIEISSVESPDVVEIHEPTEVQITLKNSGGSEGVFRRTLTVSPTDEMRTIEVTVPAGRTVTHTEEIPQPTDFDGAVDSASFQIGGMRTESQYVVPQREIGESYVTPNKMVVDISEVRYPDSVEREGGSLGPQTYEPDEGDQFILFEISVENRGDQNRKPPSQNNFKVIRDDGSEPDTFAVYPGLDSKYQFIDPVEDDSYDAGDLPTNGTTDGWILLRTTDEITLSNATLRWDRAALRSDSNEPDGLVAEWLLK
jgi:hypothetical protein